MGRYCEDNIEPIDIVGERCYLSRMRTLVDIPDDKVAALDALARRKSWSRAEAVRQGIDRLLAVEKAAEMAGLEAAFGGWAHLGVDGLAYQRDIRAEWDDRPNALVPAPEPE